MSEWAWSAIAILVLVIVVGRLTLALLDTVWEDTEQSAVAQPAVPADFRSGAQAGSLSLESSDDGRLGAGTLAAGNAPSRWFPAASGPPALPAGFVYEVRPGDSMHVLCARFRQVYMQPPIYAEEVDCQHPIIPDGSFMAIPAGAHPIAFLRFGLAVRTDRPVPPELSLPAAGDVVDFTQRPDVTSVELAIASSGDVRTAAAGRVTSLVAASCCAGGHVITVDHGVGYSTAYSPIAGPVVRVGDAVAAGALLGRAHAAPVYGVSSDSERELSRTLHFALLRDDEGARAGGD